MNNCTVKWSLHCRDWTSWALKHGIEFDSDQLTFKEKLGLIPGGQQEKCYFSLYMY